MHHCGVNIVFSSVVNWIIIRSPITFSTSKFHKCHFTFCFSCILWFIKFNVHVNSAYYLSGFHPWLHIDLYLCQPVLHTHQLCFPKLTNLQKILVAEALKATDIIPTYTFFFMISFLPSMCLCIFFLQRPLLLPKAWQCKPLFVKLMDLTHVNSGQVALPGVLMPRVDLFMRLLPVAMSDVGLMVSATLT